MPDDDLWTRLDCLEGLVTRADGIELAKHASSVPPAQAIVEVGSYKGKSTSFLAHGALAGFGALVFAVDAWDSPGNVTGRFGFAEPETFETFQAQIEQAGVSDHVTALKGHSSAAALLWPLYEKALPIGLLFIDADHAASSVRGDFHAWRPHLAPGATVIFDDIDTQRNPGVHVVVDELCAAGELTFIEKPVDTKLAVCVRP